MADDLADTMHREWHLTNGAAHSSHSPHGHSSIPTITTTDYSDRSSLAEIHAYRSLFERRPGSDAGYDTDGGIDAVQPVNNRRHTISRSHEHLHSPKIPPRNSHIHTSRESLAANTHRRPSHENHLTISPSAVLIQQHDEKAQESSRRGNKHRQQIRLSRRMPPAPPPPSATHRHEDYTAHSPSVPRHDKLLAGGLARRPLRLVFMRHSERVNQVLGHYWFIKAFESGSYQDYDPLLPKALPRRRSDLAYEFDVPLTVNGLKNARYTGRAMLGANLIPDVCLSSTAIRCVQTAERVLTGMNCAARVPIRVELGLFECPHVHQKIVDSFMNKTELAENGYNIKLEYKPLVSQINVPESLDDYFDRAVTVMRGIVDRYGHRGGTILIVTHAPGLLAFSSAIKGIRPNRDSFYRTVGAYPPLAMYIAEYDGTEWKHSEQPFSLTPFEK